MFGNKKNAAEQHRVVDIINNLLKLENAVLESRFQKTHGRVAITFNDHKVEIIEDDHGDQFKVKYAQSKVCLTKKQYKKVIDAFNTELARRNGDHKDFGHLEQIVKSAAGSSN